MSKDEVRLAQQILVKGHRRLVDGKVVKVKPHKREGGTFNAIRTLGAGPPETLQMPPLYGWDETPKYEEWWEQSDDVPVGTKTWTMYMGDHPYEEPRFRPPMLEEREMQEYHLWKRTGRTKPVTHVYRAISEEDWQRMLRERKVNTDGRMNLDMAEGTVAKANGSPHFYLPDNGAGRVIKIKVVPGDGWRVDQVDGYVKTNKDIPLDRVVEVTPSIHFKNARVDEEKHPIDEEVRTAWLKARFGDSWQLHAPGGKYYG